jgi:hypothetical protein
MFYFLKYLCDKRKRYYLGLGVYLTKENPFYKVKALIFAMNEYKF